jgi:hypothetical protein
MRSAIQVDQLVQSGAGISHRAEGHQRRAGLTAAKHEMCRAREPLCRLHQQMLDPPRKLGSLPRHREALQDALIEEQSVEAFFQGQPVNLSRYELRARFVLARERICTIVHGTNLEREPLPYEGAPVSVGKLGSCS